MGVWKCDSLCKSHVVSYMLKSTKKVIYKICQIKQRQKRRVAFFFPSPVSDMTKKK